MQSKVNGLRFVDTQMLGQALRRLARNPGRAINRAVAKGDLKFSAAGRHLEFRVVAGYLKDISI